MVKNPIEHSNLLKLTIFLYNKRKRIHINMLSNFEYDILYENFYYFI